MAYEAARQLIVKGEQVRHLILLDSACPALIPPFPFSLLDFFDGIDRFGGTGGDTTSDSISPSVPGMSTNRAKKMRDPHVIAMLRSLHRYHAESMPKGCSPTILIAARQGIDRMKRVPRPEVNDTERRVIEWV
jgi:hypothetical protein